MLMKDVCIMSSRLFANKRCDHVDIMFEMVNLTNSRNQMDYSVRDDSDRFII